MGAYDFYIVVGSSLMHASNITSGWTNKLFLFLKLGPRNLTRTTTMSIVEVAP